jgi:hypothetical protein
MVVVRVGGPWEAVGWHGNSERWNDRQLLNVAKRVSIRDGMRVSFWYSSWHWEVEPWSCNRKLVGAGNDLSDNQELADDLAIQVWRCTNTQVILGENSDSSTANCVGPRWLVGSLRNGLGVRQNILNEWNNGSPQIKKQKEWNLGVLNKRVWHWKSVQHLWNKVALKKKVSLFSCWHHKILGIL